MSKRRRRAPQPAPKAVQPAPQIVITPDAVAMLARQTAAKVPAYTTPAGMFTPAEPPPGMAMDAKLAMDDALTDVGAWAYGAVGTSSAWAMAGFPAPMPMQLLATLSQRAEFWKIADTPAVEMTRRWISITSTDDREDKTERIAGINDALKRLKVRDAFRDAVRKDGQMGRGHIFPDFGDLSDAELLTPIGTGREPGTRAKVKRGSLKAVRCIDPTWCWPLDYGTRDPLRSDWYRPQSWLVMSRKVHASRLLTIVAREVPDLLKPAYSFGGLSLTQMAEPYVANWLRARQDVSDLVHSFNTYVLKTNMMATVQGGARGVFNIGAMDGAALDARVALFTLMANNRGVMMLDKDAEDFTNVSVQLGTLDKLQAQAQEQMASVASQPLVKMFGIQPTGLNASSDGEIRVWYDHCHAMQEDHLREPLETIVDLIQLSEFGDIDTSIQVAFEPLWAMSDAERATVEKTEAETDQIRVDSGVLRPEEVRRNVATDPDSRYPGLDVDDVPDLDDEEAEGLVVKGEEGGEGQDGVEALFGAGVRAG